jgi:hypothetical protein
MKREHHCTALLSQVYKEHVKAELAQEVCLVRAFLAAEQAPAARLARTLAHLRRVFFFDFDSFAASSSNDRVNKAMHSRTMKSSKYSARITSSFLVNARVSHPKASSSPASSSFRTRKVSIVEL